MIVFTLVQSPTPVDTVQMVLHGVANSSDAIKVLRFTCHICQKKFSDSGDLRAHVRRHEAVKPFVCSDCTKRFFNSS